MSVTIWAGLIALAAFYAWSHRHFSLAFFPRLAGMGSESSRPRQSSRSHNGSNSALELRPISSKRQDNLSPRRAEDLLDWLEANQIKPTEVTMNSSGCYSIAY